MTTILTRIKHKGILFENIQGFVSTRHYILPYLISNDKIYQNQLKIFNGILKDNKLSSTFINNLFTFISDRIIFRILNEEKNIMDDNQYLPEEGENNKYQIFKKRILSIYKKNKYNETSIDINKLRKYLPKEKEFALFLFDFLENKKQILTIFTNYNIDQKNNINNFLSYYEQNKILFENKEKINQLSSDETESYYNNKKRKVLINVAFIGNRDSGKSTTIGHLLYNSGNIGQGYFTNCCNTARERGMASYKYSWLINKTKEERETLKSIMYHINKFETKKYDFNLIDLPGFFRFRKNIIKGLSLADVGVIVVSPENDTSKNDHIKDYLIISYTMGIRQLIIAINKMDSTTDGEYSEKAFLKIKKNMKNLCENIGFNIENIQFIPYSGFTGQNLVNKYEDDDINKNNKMNWYKGKTLVESLDELKPPKRNFNGPLRISVFCVDKISGVGTVLSGKILSGNLNREKELCISIRDKIIKAQSPSIEMFCMPINEAIEGDIIGFKIKGVTCLNVRCCNLVFEASDMNNIKNCDNLRVKILIVNKKATLKIGNVLTLYCYTLNVPIKIVKLEYIVDEVNKIIEKDPKNISYGRYGIAIIKIIKKDKSIYSWRKNLFYFFEKYINNHFLGSFELLDDDLTAVGNIKDINVV